MNPTDRILWRCGLAKLGAPETLTAAEKEVLSFYGSDSIRARLTPKAIVPADPPPPKPAPVPAVSRASVNKAVAAVAEAAGLEMGRQLRARDATIAELTRASADTAIQLREELRALQSRILDLEADRAAREIPIP